MDARHKNRNAGTSAANTRPLHTEKAPPYTTEFSARCVPYYNSVRRFCTEGAGAESRGAAGFRRHVYGCFIRTACLFCALRGRSGPAHCVFRRYPPSRRSRAWTFSFFMSAGGGPFRPGRLSLHARPAVQLKANRKLCLAGQFTKSPGKKNITCGALARDPALRLFCHGGTLPFDPKKMARTALRGCRGDGLGPLPCGG